MKTILISGVSGSIGSFLANFFLDKGFFVIGISRRSHSVDKFVDSYQHFSVDLADQKSISVFLKKVRERKITIDGFIHCAGLSSSAITTSISNQVVHELMDVNFIGSIAFLKEVLKIMNPHKKGSVVNMSSITASAFNHGSATYASSKVAFEHFCKQAAIENSRYGIRINTLRLPLVEETNMNNSLSPGTKNDLMSGVILQREIKLQEIANVCNWLISEESSVITGEIMTPGGGRW